MARVGRSLWLIADDYGFSPQVSSAIRELIAAGRLSGTGCMTLFEDWQEQGKWLADVGASTSIGLHLTLTDFPALTTGVRMPGLKRLIADCARGENRSVAAEADAQMERFHSVFGRDPAFIDGHQHVHFLRPVRHWLCRRFADLPPQRRPWLRGAPTLRAAPAGLTAKVAFARLLARGFDMEMRRSGFRVRGPLGGFYDWRKQGTFDTALPFFLKKMPENGVVMCHPGRVDALLRQRDVFTDAREEELALLSSDHFATLLARGGISLATEQGE